MKTWSPASMEYECWISHGENKRIPVLFRFLFLHNLWSNVFLINGCRMHQLLTHLFFGRFVITAAPRQRGRRAFESAWLEFRLWSFWSKPNKAPVVESGKKRGKTFGVMVWQWCQGNLPCYNGKNTSSFMVDFQGIARAYFKYFKFNPWPFWGGDFLVPKPPQTNSERK